MKKFLQKLRGIWDEIFGEYPPMDLTKVYNIIINGKGYDYDFDVIFYDELLLLIGRHEVVYSITYYKGPAINPQGTLMLGDFVSIQDGMVFNVIDTSGA